MPDTPRLAKTSVPSGQPPPARSTSRTGLDAASTRRSRKAPVAAATSRATSGPVNTGQPSSTRSTACAATELAARHSPSQATSPGARSSAAARANISWAVPNRRTSARSGPGSPGCRCTRSTATSGRASSRVTGRERVGRPNATTRSTRPPSDGRSSNSRYAATRFGPPRDPDVGSASRGSPQASANRRASGPDPSPATTTVRRVNVGSTSASADSVVGAAYGDSTGTVQSRESSALGRHGLRSSGSNGSSKARLSRTGPGRRSPVPRAAATASRAAAPQASTGSSGSRSTVSLVAAPKSPTCRSLVWLAQVPRSRGGRSAASTSSGTPL